MKQDTMMFLELVREVRISELLKGAGDERYEASGVCLKDGYLHLIFDDKPHFYASGWTGSTGGKNLFYWN